MRHQPLHNGCPIYSVLTVVSPLYKYLLMLQALYPDQIMDVILLALIFMQVPVSPMELVGRAYSGELPYFRFLRQARKTHDEHNEKHLSRVIDRSGQL